MVASEAIVPATGVKGGTGRTSSARPEIVCLQQKHYAQVKAYATQNAFTRV
jgi:hypothetical protein